MSELPKGWVSTTIGGVNAYSGSNIDPLKSPEQMFELYSVPIYPTRKPETVNGQEIGSTKQSLEPNDVLLCKINPRINRVWKVGPVGGFTQIGSSEWIVIRQSLINADFLRYQLSEGSFREVLCAEVSGVGGSLTRAQPKKVINYSIVLPPLAEQTRIAKKLDELLAQVDTLKARINAIPALLKRFRQSVLAAAVSGRLTEEWRNTNGALQLQSLQQALSYLKKFKSEQIKLKNVKSDLAFGESPTDGEYLGNIPDVWKKLRIRDISIKITDGEHATPKRQIHGHYLLSARNIGNSEILLSDVDYVGDDEYQRIRKRCDPSIGDVLISCSGSVGRVALVDKNDAYVMVRSAALVRPLKEIVNIKYLMYFLQSPLAQVQIATRSKSTAQANLFLGEIKEIEFSYPSLDEQTEIVSRVDQLFAFADQLEAKVVSAKTRIDHLTQSILAKAFRGELVPQDPNDEPASVLLERIKAQRAAAPKAKRGRKASV
jgi:type I restriction enzyme S subunit